MDHALSYISEIFSPSLFTIPYFEDGTLAIPTIMLVMFFIVIEWIGRESQYAIQFIQSKRSMVSWPFYYLIVILIFIFAGSNQQFIYFQF